MNTNAKPQDNTEYYSPKICYRISVLVTLVPFVFMFLLATLDNSLFLEELLFDASFHFTPISILVDTLIPLFAIVILFIVAICLPIMNTMKIFPCSSITHRILYTGTIFALVCSSIMFSLFMGTGAVLRHSALGLESLTKVTNTNYDDFSETTYTESQLVDTLRRVLNVNELPTELTAAQRHKITSSLITSYCKFYNHTSEEEIDYFRAIVYALPSVQNYIKSEVNTMTFPLRIVELMINNRLYTIDEAIQNKLVTHLITYWVNEIAE